jgi:hypothetical protein
MKLPKLTDITKHRWRVLDIEDRPPLVITAEHPTCGYQVVARVYGASPVTAQANAELLAAAPELVAECIRLKKEVRRLKQLLKDRP